MLQRFLLAALMSVPLLIGCDPLYDGDSAPAPLLEVRGVTDGASSAANPQVAMLWLTAAPAGVALQAAAVELESQFPASWAIAIHDLPDATLLGGAWSGVPYLPEHPDVGTLFGVLIAYDDLDGDGEPGFDFAGYDLLRWISGSELPPSALTGADLWIGHAQDVLVAAVVAPEGAMTLGDAAGDDPQFPASVAELATGLGAYAWEPDTECWRAAEDDYEATLVLR